MINTEVFTHSLAVPDAAWARCDVRRSFAAPVSSKPLGRSNDMRFEPFSTKSAPCGVNQTATTVGTARMCRERKGRGYGKAVVRNQPVPGRLRRPYGVCAKPHALPPLHRGGSGAGGQWLRSPDVWGHGGLGAGSC